MMQSRLIVIEGIDGSGKSTQFNMLCSRLEEDGIDFQRVIFPRYSEDSSALLRMYLKGDFGKNPEDLSAYAASVLYAVDRFASFRLDWGKSYSKGSLILCDRYVSSNAVHQGAKLKESERAAFLDWLNKFEYEIMELPRPDLVLYMDVDINTALHQIASRSASTGVLKDIHETNESYLKKCLAAGDFAAGYCGWQRVVCTNGLEMRAANDIHEDIYKAVKAIL